MRVGYLYGICSWLENSLIHLQGGSMGRVWVRVEKQAVEGKDPKWKPVVRTWGRNSVMSEWGRRTEEWNWSTVCVSGRGLLSLSVSTTISLDSACRLWCLTSIKASWESLSVLPARITWCLRSPSVWVATTSATLADRQSQVAQTVNSFSWKQEISLWRTCRYRWSFLAVTVSTGARTHSLIMHSANTMPYVATVRRSVQWTTWVSKCYALGLELPKTSKNTFREHTRTSVRITVLSTSSFYPVLMLLCTATNFYLRTIKFSVIAC
jgi:hypothetical protein